MLCGTKNDAGYSRGSKTKQIYFHSVMQGKAKFTIIDTPGTWSRNDVYKNSYLLKECLTFKPINAIFLMVPFEARANHALDQAEKSASILKDEYQKMVVVIISKFDQCDEKDQEKAKKDYIEVFAEEDFVKIIFINKEMDPIHVALMMQNCMKNMPHIQLEYDDTAFYINFQVAGNSKIQRKWLAKIRKELELLSKKWEDMVGSLEVNETNDEIIMSAITQNRWDLDQVYERFHTTFGEEMVDTDCYANAIKLQKIIHELHTKFRVFAKQRMSYNPDDSNDWRNAVRKCTHCGEIWVKVCGCDGETTCGARPKDKFDALQGRPWTRYTFFEVAGRFLWMDQTDSTTGSKLSEESKENRQNTGDRAKGCGREIVWKNLPRLTADELNEKILEVKGLENVLNALREKPDFQRSMAQMNERIQVDAIGENKEEEEQRGCVPRWLCLCNY